MADWEEWIDPHIVRAIKVEHERLSPSDWIMRRATNQETPWLSMTEQERVQTMIASIIAYLEEEWIKKNTEV